METDSIEDSRENISNSRSHRQTYFFHRDMLAGGTLEFVMTDMPVKDWFTDFSSSEVGGKFTAAPLIEGPRVFKDKTEITIRSLSPEAKITYTVDDHGEEFARKTREYTGPFVIEESARVEAYATDPRTRLRSKTTEADFGKRSNDFSVKLLASYSSQYTGGGNEAIIDGLRATANFASGE